MNPYNYGISYFLELVNKDIVLSRGKIGNISYLVGLGKEFYYNTMVLDFEILQFISHKTTNTF